MSPNRFARNHWIHLTVILVALAGQWTHGADETRPNILLICTDEQFAGAMSAAGDPNLSTPAMDSIAASGVTFKMAYSAQASCVPARSSFMTGLMPDQNGVNYNGGNIPLTGACAAKYLKDAGYRTGYVGKWHLPRSITDKAWSGFDYTSDIKNNSVDFDIPDGVRPFLEASSDKPFFLVASFVNPHDICQWARMLSGIKDELNNGEIGTPPPVDQCPPLPANFDIPEFEPSAVREGQFAAQINLFPTREWEGASGEVKWRKYLWGYYRFMELVDGYIGEVLDDIERLGFMDNTVIIFTSDHGDGMGAHRWNQKYVHYDESTRIPFIVSWKDRTLAGFENDDRLINQGLDLFPTIFDFAGIDKPEYMMGLSARSEAMGEEIVPIRHDYIVSEIEIQQAYGVRSPYLARMVRSPHYKYVIYNRGSHKEQFFDMEQDPGETISLVYDPAYKFILNEHRRMLDGWVSRIDDSWGYFEGNPDEETDILSGGEGLDGWRDSWRYGAYHVADWPWIYHMDSGWQYVDESTTQNGDVYIFDHNENAWRYVTINAPYWFYDYGKSSWMRMNFPS